MSAGHTLAILIVFIIYFLNKHYFKTFDSSAGNDNFNRVENDNDEQVLATTRENEMS